MKGINMEIDPKDKERYENLVQCLNFLKQEIKEIEDKLINRELLKSVDELELSARVMNVFKNDSIVYLGDLVQKSAGELLRTPNFGRLSLKEINGLLKERNLSLGMDIIWPPQVTNLQVE
jgi:DNA-directed RNA polymerase subunit alpha